MMKYIPNKKAEKDKANDVNDFKGVGEVGWNFILSLYKSEWDELIADKINQLFRHKIKAQFTPKINVGDNYKTNRRENSTKLVSISLLSPPILVKSPKKINEISKIFKKNTDKKD